MDKKLYAVILAAGKGTRLRTEGCDLPKVMRVACGRPLLSYVTEALSFIPKEDMTVVVGYKREKVVEAFEGYRFAVQEEQLGTGHAVACALEQSELTDGAVLVCCGDMPLISAETYEALVRTHFDEGNSCTFLTGTSDIPLPYGRVKRDADGKFLCIVEDRDCSEEEKKIEELNSGVYVFDAAMLGRALKELRNDNVQGEYYLTDAPAIMTKLGGTIGICRRELGFEIIGVNSIEQLNQVEEILSR
ncbi:MAG: NTP transferase domain-containing protein [Oscillospiraceae bacterium]|nr:NTP transferase domain-containing protein [Oscillospiraceae bacterium]